MRASVFCGRLLQCAAYRWNECEVPQFAENLRCTPQHTIKKGYIVEIARLLQRGEGTWSMPA